ncbi:hypothetical protein NPX13_g6957 [Xylaria arbuscula]|uniref:Uncharacterized protein n=1 Tax=Xylaria arbuscula TaxID=114810 RepID=A0A9W8NB88_9PEZI|nr:hypothetical protein NPX13_g6957 [Xylaria arbuscula]
MKVIHLGVDSFGISVRFHEDGNGAFFREKDVLTLTRKPENAKKIAADEERFLDHARMTVVLNGDGGLVSAADVPTSVEDAFLTVFDLGTPLVADDVDNAILR